MANYKPHHLRTPIIPQTKTPRMCVRKFVLFILVVFESVLRLVSYVTPLFLIFCLCKKEYRKMTRH